MRQNRTEWNGMEWDMIGKEMRIRGQNGIEQKKIREYDRIKYRRIEEERMRGIGQIRLVWYFIKQNMKGYDRV